jgi:hypothetical protein
MLDIIMQIAKKAWASDHCLAGLVRALNAIFDPQANLCSFGADKAIDEARVRRLIDRIAPF